MQFTLIFKPFAYKYCVLKQLPENSQKWWDMWIWVWGHTVLLVNRYGRNNSSPSASSSVLQ